MSVTAQTLCPRCEGSAPRGFLFCLTCAVGIFDQDESGESLFHSLAVEYEALGQKIHDGYQILAELPDAAKKARGWAKIATWRRQRETLAYVLNIWRG